MDNGIILREWREEDSQAVEKMIDDTWWKGSMSENSSMLVSTAFLRSCLQDQTYIRVAEKDGKILGVIMGCDRRHHHATFTERLRYWQSAVHILFDTEARKAALDCGNEGKLHRELFEKAGNRKYDAEVTFFIVSEEARGMGIGRKLFDALSDYFDSADVKSWYVFTDTDCTYQFYEHVGARRRSEIYQQYTLPDGRKGDITWFLYDYDRK